MIISLYNLDHTVNNYPQALKEARGAGVDDVRWGPRVRSAAAMDSITVEQVTAKLDAILG